MYQRAAAMQHITKYALDEVGRAADGLPSVEATQKQGHVCTYLIQTVLG